MEAIASYAGNLGALDLGGQVAALAIENGDAERTTAHVERDAEEHAEAAADAAQVQAMHDEASKMRTQGWFDGGMAVGTAVLRAYCPAASAVTEGGTKIGDACFQASQHDDEATAAAQKAASDQAQTAVKDASDTVTDADANISTALDFYRTYTATEAATQQAALHHA
jgi:hypothetical protein